MHHALSLLRSARTDPLAGLPALVGLDGFVDTILHVVDQRQTATEYTRLAEIAEFAARVAAASGRSGNFELIPQLTKLGGNGPIMANALAGFGSAVTYLGNLGAPNLHPVFHEFAGRCERVISIAEPAFTDAIEFEDGKLMCGKSQVLQQIAWPNIVAHLPLPELRAIFARARLIALVNWTMVVNTTDILRAILREIAPGLPPIGAGAGPESKRWTFFDLADPAKRTREDIAELLDVLMAFQRHFRVMLGLNFQEARQIGAVLGLPEPTDQHGPVTEHVAAIQERLGLDTVVIHSMHFAAAADTGGATFVAGPYTPKPLITTGAGDHFNAGFCLGRLLGGGLEASLGVGGACSGYYVRRAESPSVAQLRDFTESL